MAFGKSILFLGKEVRATVSLSSSFSEMGLTIRNGYNRDLLTHKKFFFVVVTASGQYTTMLATWPLLYFFHTLPTVILIEVAGK